MATSGALDRAATALGSTITASTGTTSVTSQANELAVTFLGALGSSFGPATNGFSEVAELASQSVVHEKVVTATGSYGHTCTLNSPGISWQGVILTYRAKQLP